MTSLTPVYGINPFVKDIPYEISVDGQLVLEAIDFLIVSVLKGIQQEIRVTDFTELVAQAEFPQERLRRGINNLNELGYLDWYGTTIGFDYNIVTEKLLRRYVVIRK